MACHFTGNLASIADLSHKLGTRAAPDRYSDLNFSVTMFSVAEGGCDHLQHSWGHQPMNMKRFAFAGSTAVLFATPALAGIEISPAVMILETAAKQTEAITVTNSGDKIAYVTVQPREVMARGEVDEKLRVDPNPTSLGLLATPARLVMEKGERRAVRIVAVSAPGSDDRVWRVKIAPAAGKLKAKQSGVAFLIGYDALIIQRAANAKVSVTGKRLSNVVTLTNNGNSFGMISDVKYCPAAGECTKLPDTKRLYAGRSWSVTLPQAGGTAEITVDGLNGKKDVLKI
jgi:P pilus assembly chaperone PapD